MAQINGFSTAQVKLMAFETKTDTHLSWLGSQINDKFLVNLRESSVKLNAARKGCTKDGVLVVHGRKVWHGAVKHDGKGTYVRDGGTVGLLVGSVAELKAAYGTAAIYPTLADAEKSFKGLKSFNPTVKVQEKKVPAKVVKKPAAKVGKITKRK